MMNPIDRVISWFSPERALHRIEARASLSQMNKLFGVTKGPYAAADRNRLNLSRNLVQKENQVSGSRIDFLRAQSWDLYRDNPSCRKIIRSLEAKVIGKGMHPESLATNIDGSPHVAFRERSMQLWEDLQSGFDARGLPGKGGLTMGCQQRLALRTAVLSGDTLYRAKPITQAEQDKRNLPIPLVLQLVDSCRLAEESEIQSTEIPEGHVLFRGIEFNANNERVAYWVKNVSIVAAADAVATATRVPADKMGHLYFEEDIDQARGVPWFSAAIIRARRTDDLETNVLTTSAMAACVVAAYSKPTGAARLGLNQSAEHNSTSADGSDLTDTDGNTITKIQPGMVVNKGKDGSFELMTPNQPNMNPEAFVQHLQRGTASALPGTKSSTVTGDYRNSSFSSERSADNDAWPEINIVQEWFASSYCQPIWETILRTAIMEGYFDGIVSAEEFQSSPGRFCAANWQGPVALSINPKDDAASASARVKGGISSVQMECAKVNVNWRDVLNDHAELYAVAKEKGIPDEVVSNMLGIEVMSRTTQGTGDDVDDDDDDADEKSSVNKEPAGVA
jgi:lambda family phage portal protein